MKPRFFQAVTSMTRFRFSLASLFLIVTVISVLLGMKVHAVRSQRNTIAAIHAVGGTVAYDYQYESDIIVGPSVLLYGMLDTRKALSVPFELDRLLGVDYFASVVRVDLSGSDADDDLVARLTCLSHLKDLNLGRTAVSDAGLQYMNSFPQLEFLNLQGTSITDRGLEQLESLKSLELLNLGGTYVTDKGLAALQQFPLLSVLHLDNTISYMNGVHKETRASLVTRGGLQYVSPCTRLEYLSLGGTQIKSGDTDALEQVFIP